MYAVTDLVVGLGAVAPRTIMNSMQKKRGEMEGEKKENRGGRGGGQLGITAMMQNISSRRGEATGSLGVSAFFLACMQIWTHK
jgi:hypothetical protein